MSKEIKAIEIFCENLDWIRIPSDYIEKIEIYQSKEYSETQLAIVLSADASRDAKKFDEDMHCLDAGTETLFERLQNPDITQISICYTDITKDDYNVIWKDWKDNEYRNQYQKTELCKDGSLIIRICESMLNY